MSSAVFVSRHGERLDYKCLARGELWQATATRPWDTPLTDAGHMQGEAMGRACNEHVTRHNVQPVRRIFTSPLLRCAETAAAAATQLGISTISVEPALAETMCESWYRSWGVPGADSTWGGPKDGSFPLGSVVDDEALHPGCLRSAQEIHNTPEVIAQELKQRYPAVTIDLGYAAFAPDTGSQYRWGSFEEEEAQAERMGGFVKAISAQSEGETVLCVSHGGPCIGLYNHLLQCTSGPNCGFTGLYLYKTSEERWEALLAGDQSHLQKLKIGEASGHNDAAEQGKQTSGALF